LSEALNAIYEISKAHSVDVHVGGHLADGNLHPGVSIRLDDPVQKDRVSKWYRDIMQMAMRLGGTVSSEHGIGLVKKDGLREELETLGSAKALDIMRAIKKAWDPKGLLNPGKVV
ncbi:MAG: glycolate oxidase subunit GlcD, partial [Desulfurococcales archaeon]|nr:glycolate oxidase subunit GlcD [Desulfurococcales archaeon]